MEDVNEAEINHFQILILDWFGRNGRKFSWRNKTANNYRRIISEVLLQRTQANTVAAFFPIFLKSYPSWRKLGGASELELQEILKPVGLYKQRGARLYQLAQEMQKRRGRFPKDRKEIEKLPMMGQYITNACQMFVFNEPSPLLDVNMARVLERYFGARKLADIRFDPYLQSLSKKVVEHENFIEINWAILDFGALVCKKINPQCSKCPLSKKCLHFNKL